MDSFSHESPHPSGQAFMLAGMRTYTCTYMYTHEHIHEYTYTNAYTDMVSQGLVIDTIKDSGGWSGRYFRGFHHVAPGASEIRDNICKTESKMDSHSSFQIWGSPSSKCRSDRRVLQNRGFVARIREFAVYFRLVPRHAPKI